jgi:hypothetical protein
LISEGDSRIYSCRLAIGTMYRDEARIPRPPGGCEHEISDQHAGRSCCALGRCRPFAQLPRRILGKPPLRERRAWCDKPTNAVQSMGSFVHRLARQCFSNNGLLRRVAPHRLLLGASVSSPPMPPGHKAAAGRRGAVFPDGPPFPPAHILVRTPVSLFVYRRVGRPIRCQKLRETAEASIRKLTRATPGQGAVNSYKRVPYSKNVFSGRGAAAAAAPSVNNAASSESLLRGLDRPARACLKARSGGRRPARGSVELRISRFLCVLTARSS